VSKKARQVRPGFVIGSNLKAPQGGKWVSHWDGIIQSYEPGPDAKIEAVKAAIDAGVTAFETHKEKLLPILREAYERGTKSEPFDENRTWRHLTFLAGHYFWRERVKQEVLPAANRSERLLKIAEALGDARRLVDEAQQDELVNDLYSAWCDQNIRYDVDPEGPLVLVRFQDEFDKVVAALSALEAAACKARDDVVPQVGRPTGSILSPDVIHALAHEYQQSTGLKLDKLTDEHFVEFVREFAAAVVRARKVDALEAIKYALKLKRKKDRQIRE
jgi:hypothetical protein